MTPALKKSLLAASIMLLASEASFASHNCSSTPFGNNNGSIPPKAEYSGPLFQLSHDYPDAASTSASPWRDAIGQQTITVDNADKYVAALKKFISSDFRAMIADANWNPAKNGWYHAPWLNCERESIHGMYVGSSDFDKDLFDGTGLKKDFSTYVLTMYNEVAANTLYNVWQTDAMNPQITATDTQFAENSVVTKYAFTTANSDNWDAMQGALEWPLYITVNATTGDHKTSQLDKASLMQFDLIVKDTQSAPDTGWVFATLVYDKDAPGKDVWDKMVPLGAMWGNDPEVNSTKNPSQPLTQNWINPNAPEYAKKTLGWGGRLSGPNDGGMNDAIVNVDGKPTKMKNLPSSSCLSCHGSAEWPMHSFLLPTTTMPPQSKGDYLMMWPPGSPQWMQWFQSRAGNVPQDIGTTAFDYDMVFVFKSLPAWQKATTGRPTLLQGLDRTGKPINKFQNYDGSMQE
ncbi:MAG: hypothetical protein P1U67_01475 [Alcanivoracaceae bacterium]|nr:hypothetical protein [Alcanivoracaceae bacterium]